MCNGIAREAKDLGQHSTPAASQKGRIGSGGEKSVFALSLSLSRQSSDSRSSFFASPPAALYTSCRSIYFAVARGDESSAARIPGVFICAHVQARFIRVSTRQLYARSSFCSHLRTAAAAALCSFIIEPRTLLCRRACLRIEELWMLRVNMYCAKKRPVDFTAAEICCAL